MNILTIDVDYAYSPSINSYDDYITGSKIKIETEVALMNKRGFKAFENPHKLKDISKCLDLVKSVAPVYIIKYHHQILHFLPENIKYSVYNIDHHHDVYYPDWHNKEELDEGNWVYHLPNCSDYTWIKNNKSEALPDHNLSFKVTEMLFSEETLKLLPKFDMVVFCESPHWTGNNGSVTIKKIIKEWMKKCI